MQEKQSKWEKGQYAVLYTCTLSQFITDCLLGLYLQAESMVLQASIYLFFLAQSRLLQTLWGHYDGSCSAKAGDAHTQSNNACVFV